MVDSFAGTVEKLPGGLCARTRDYFVPRSTPGWFVLHLVIDFVL